MGAHARGRFGAFRGKAPAALRVFAFCTLARSVALGQNATTRPPWMAPASPTLDAGAAPASVGRDDPGDAAVTAPSGDRAHDSSAPTSPTALPVPGSAPPANERGRAASASPAAALDDDLVVMRSGREVRGVAVEVRFGEVVRMRTSDGATHDIAWTDVAAVSGPTFRRSAGQLPPPAPGTRVGDTRTVISPAPNDSPVGANAMNAATLQLRNDPRAMLRPGARRVALRIESDGARLPIAAPREIPNAVVHTSEFDPMPAMGSSGGLFGPSFGLGMWAPTVWNVAPTAPPTSFAFLCNTPCTLYLAPGANRMRIGGGETRESDEVIDVRNDAPRVRFHSASRSAYSAGQIFVWLGAGALLVGSLLLVNTFTNCAGSMCDVVLPAAVSVGGGVALAVGIPLVAANFTGRVRTRDDP